MRRFLLTATMCATCMLPLAANAWEYTDAIGTVNNMGGAGGNGGNGYGGQGGNGGNAQAKSYQRQSQAQNSTNNNTINVQNGGGGWRGAALGNTPSVDAPAVVTGNACAEGWSGSFNAPFVGGSFGKTTPDKLCELRQEVALAWTIGARNVAVARMCDNEDMHKAINEAGGRCPTDTVTPPVTVVFPPNTPTYTATPVSNYSDVPVTDYCKARPGWTEKEARAQAAKEGTPCP